MSSLVILISDSVFACGRPRKSFGDLIVIFRCWGRGAEDAIVLCIQYSLLIFLLLGSRFLSSYWRGEIPTLIVELFITNLWKYFVCFFLDSSNSSRFS